jgi:hypothetical protein
MGLLPAGVQIADVTLVVADSGLDTHQRSDGSYPVAQVPVLGSS